jgi:4-diphosphocytidyl-2-C-methyl-D-erythritol kinase
VNWPRTEIAYAKINLALHVRKRRKDGYHELETLFAFLDCGDVLTATEGKVFALDQTGPFGGNTGGIDDNLVTRAALLANDGILPKLRFDLDKRLPVAAGLGGGSADAGAAFRLLDAGDRHDLAAQLGADVPACLDSVPVIGRGTGTELWAVENDVAGLACLLVNPGVPLTTGPVFKAWDGIDHGPMPEGSARAIMMAGRNDLETPAKTICPAIGDVLGALNTTEPLIVRMSGSGASCFALYDDPDDAARAQGDMAGLSWWTMLGTLR